MIPQHLKFVIIREENNIKYLNESQKKLWNIGLVLWFKLHLVCNEKGQVADFLITKANVDDRYPLKDKKITIKYLKKIMVIKCT